MEKLYRAMTALVLMSAMFAVVFSAFGQMAVAIVFVAIMAAGCAGAGVSLIVTAARS